MKVPELVPAEGLEPGAHLLVIICVSIPVLGPGDAETRPVVDGALRGSQRGRSARR